MPIVLADRRSATAALAQMHARDLNLCTNLHCSRRILALTDGPSCLETSSTNALMAVDCHHAPVLPRSNPHSATGTTPCHFPRFRSLKAFGRRPRCTPHRRHRPPSETLNNRYRRIKPIAPPDVGCCSKTGHDFASQRNVATCHKKTSAMLRELAAANFRGW